MFAIGSQKMNTKLEPYYNIEKPTGVTDWSLNWTLQFLFPRSLSGNYNRHEKMRSREQIFENLKRIAALFNEN